MTLNTKWFCNINIGYEVLNQGVTVKTFCFNNFLKSKSFPRAFTPIASFTYVNRPFDKKRLKLFVNWSFQTVGDKKTVDLVESLKNMGYFYATKAGISLSIDDLKIPQKKTSLLASTGLGLEQAQEDVEKNYLSSIEYVSQVLNRWNATSELIKDEVIENFQADDILNPVYMMAFSGARGNISQVRQLTGMRGLMADPSGQIIDFPIQSNFREGLTLTEYMISCYGARKGVVDTALRTATSGYLTRRLVDVAHHVSIRVSDCQTKKGLILSDLKDGNKIVFNLKDRLIGRVLAKPVSDPNNALIKIAVRNQEISHKLANRLSALQQPFLIRSPITCSDSRFICQLCYGWSLALSRLVSIGESVGIIAAQSIGEPGTQLTMRTFHTGGVFSSDVADEIRAPFNGWIYFPDTILGRCVRTIQGQIGFLTKQSCCFFLREPVQQKSYEISLEPYSIIFVKQNQFMVQDQVIAEISVMYKLKKSINAYETVYSSLSGEVRVNSGRLIQNIPKIWVSNPTIEDVWKYLGFPPDIEDEVLQEILDEGGFDPNSVQKNFVNQQTSEFWILAAQRQILFDYFSHLIVQPGDWLDYKMPIHFYQNNTLANHYYSQVSQSLQPIENKTMIYKSLLAFKLGLKTFNCTFFPHKLTAKAFLWQFDNLKTNDFDFYFMAKSKQPSTVKINPNLNFVLKPSKQKTLQRLNLFEFPTQHWVTINQQKSLKFVKKTNSVTGGEIVKQYCFFNWQFLKKQTILTPKRRKQKKNWYGGLIFKLKKFFQKRWAKKQSKKVKKIRNSKRSTISTIQIAPYSFSFITFELKPNLVPFNMVTFINLKIKLIMAFFDVQIRHFRQLYKNKIYRFNFNFIKKTLFNWVLNVKHSKFDLTTNFYALYFIQIMLLQLKIYKPLVTLSKFQSYFGFTTIHRNLIYELSLFAPSVMSSLITRTSLIFNQTTLNSFNFTRVSNGQKLILSVYQFQQVLLSFQKWFLRFSRSFKFAIVPHPSLQVIFNKAQLFLTLKTNFAKKQKLPMRSSQMRSICAFLICYEFYKCFSVNLIKHQFKKKQSYRLSRFFHFQTSNRFLKTFSLIPLSLKKRSNFILQTSIQTTLCLKNLLPVSLPLSKLVSNFNFQKPESNFLFNSLIFILPSENKNQMFDNFSNIYKQQLKNNLVFSTFNQTMLSKIQSKSKFKNVKKKKKHTFSKKNNVKISRQLIKYSKKQPLKQNFKRRKEKHKIKLLLQQRLVFEAIFVWYVNKQTNQFNRNSHYFFICTVSLVNYILNLLMNWSHLQLKFDKLTVSLNRQKQKVIKNNQLSKKTLFYRNLILFKHYSIFIFLQQKKTMSFQLKYSWDLNILTTNSQQNQLLKPFILHTITHYLFKPYSLDNYFYVNNKNSIFYSMLYANAMTLKKQAISVQKKHSYETKNNTWLTSVSPFFKTTITGLKKTAKKPAVKLKTMFVFNLWVYNKINIKLKSLQQQIVKKTLNPLILDLKLLQFYKQNFVKQCSRELLVQFCITKQSNLLGTDFFNSAEQPNLNYFNNLQTPNDWINELKNNFKQSKTNVNLNSFKKRIELDMKYLLTLIHLNQTRRWSNSGLNTLMLIRLQLKVIANQKVINMFNFISQIKTEQQNESKITPFLNNFYAVLNFNCKIVNFKFKPILETNKVSQFVGWVYMTNKLTNSLTYHNKLTQAGVSKSIFTSFDSYITVNRLFGNSANQLTYKSSYYDFWSSCFLTKNSFGKTMGQSSKLIIVFKNHYQKMPIFISYIFYFLIHAIDNPLKQMLNNLFGQKKLVLYSNFLHFFADIIFLKKKIIKTPLKKIQKSFTFTRQPHEDLKNNALNLYYRLLFLKQAKLPLVQCYKPFKPMFLDTPVRLCMLKSKLISHNAHCRYKPELLLDSIYYDSTFKRKKVKTVLKYNKKKNNRIVNKTKLKKPKRSLLSLEQSNLPILFCQNPFFLVVQKAQEIYPNDFCLKQRFDFQTELNQSPYNFQTAIMSNKSPWKCLSSPNNTTLNSVPLPSYRWKPLKIQYTFYNEMWQQLQIFGFQPEFLREIPLLPFNIIWFNKLNKFKTNLIYSFWMRFRYRFLYAQLSTKQRSIPFFKTEQIKSQVQPFVSYFDFSNSLTGRFVNLNFWLLGLIELVKTNNLLLLQLLFSSNLLTLSLNNDLIPNQQINQYQKKFNMRIRLIPKRNLQTLVKKTDYSTVRFSVQPNQVFFKKKTSWKKIKKQTLNLKKKFPFIKKIKLEEDQIKRHKISRITTLTRLILPLFNFCDESILKQNYCLTEKTSLFQPNYLINLQLYNYKSKVNFTLLKNQKVAYSRNSFNLVNLKNPFLKKNVSNSVVPKKLINPKTGTFNQNFNANSTLQTNPTVVSSSECGELLFFSNPLQTYAKLHNFDSFLDIMKYGRDFSLFTNLGLQRFIEIYYLTAQNLISYSLEKYCSFKQITPLISIGHCVPFNTPVFKGHRFAESGQLILITKKQLVLRRAKSIIFPRSSSSELQQNDFVNQDTPLVHLNYKEIINEDIIQGIPKIERFFEARSISPGLTLSQLLKEKFKQICTKQRSKKLLKFKLRSANQALVFIQHYTLNAIQKVYQSQGVMISDKHVEIIVKQMTSKVIIQQPGRSGFLKGDLIDFQWVQYANAFTENTNEIIQYEPFILGITQASLQTDGFISAASFQETVNVLTKAAYFRKTDFLFGLKENVILGHLIAIGTGIRF